MPGSCVTNGGWTSSHWTLTSTSHISWDWLAGQSSLCWSSIPEWIMWKTPVYCREGRTVPILLDFFKTFSLSTYILLKADSYDWCPWSLLVSTAASSPTFPWSLSVYSWCIKLQKTFIITMCKLDQYSSPLSILSDQFLITVLLADGIQYWVILSIGHEFEGVEGQTTCIVWQIHFRLSPLVTTNLIFNKKLHIRCNRENKEYLAYVFIVYI